MMDITFSFRSDKSSSVEVDASSEEEVALTWSDENLHASIQTSKMN